VPQRDETDTPNEERPPGSLYDVGVAELARIRRIVRSCRGGTRGAIATAVCRELGWRRANGALRVRACRIVLARLAECGRLKLPPRRSRGPRPRAAESIAARAAADGESRTPATSAPTVRPVALRRITVRPIERAELRSFRAAMARHHYLGDGRVVGESIRHVAEVDGRWLALLAWGAAALKSRHREAWIGWDEATKHRRLHLVTNNVRFLVLPDARVPHLASAVLARSVARLSRDFEARYGHPVLVAETFVDCERFAGTCYRAANWTRLGETRGMARKGRGYEEHGRKKALFAIELERRARQLLAAPMLPPQILRRMAMARLPAVQVDVNALPLEGAGGLIEALRQICDPRDRRGLRHSFEGIVAAAVMACLSGMRSYEAIAEWAADLPREVCRRLRFHCWRAPSEATFRRVLQSVDGDEVDAVVGAWLATWAGNGAVAVDGKALRGSHDGETPAVHLISALTHDERVVVAQRNVGAKTNEIPEAGPLLRAVPLAGRTVTADALHTQRELATHLVDERGADYVFIVKGNQPTLLAQVEGVAWESLPPSGHDDGPRARTGRAAHDLADR
jgi:predicted transposase YbfD/YdcC